MLWTPEQAALREIQAATAALQNDQYKGMEGDEFYQIGVLRGMLKGLSDCSSDAIAVALRDLIAALEGERKVSPVVTYVDEMIHTQARPKCLDATCPCQWAEEDEAAL